MRLLLVFILALALRVAYVSVWIMNHPEIYNAPQFHAAELGSVATNIYEGQGFSSPFGPGNQPSALFAPFVPLFWAGLMYLTGGPSGATVAAIAYVNAIVSAVSVCFYWLCAKLLQKSQPVALKGYSTLITAALVLWPESIIQTANPWYFSFQELGVAAVVYVGILWLNSPTLKYASLLGLSAGALANINPTPLPVYACIAAAPLIYRQNRSPAVLRGVALSAAIAVLCVMPWTVRNYLVFERFIPLRSGLGSELRQGNNEFGSIRQDSHSAYPSVKPEERARFYEMGEIEYNEWATREAVNYVLQHPKETAARIVKRAYVLWFTDITDRWSWSPDNKWWNRGASAIVLAVSSAFFAVVSILLISVGIVSRRLAVLPNKTIFVSLMVFLPLPYYFTHAAPVYTYHMRIWLAFVASIVLVQWLCESKWATSTKSRVPLPLARPGS